MIFWKSLEKYMLVLKLAGNYLIFFFSPDFQMGITFTTIGNNVPYKLTLAAASVPLL